ncbi:hypothetical protein HER39_11555, partial [Arthrobacter deserti]|nr:hypothetical protein [Arthrobacter deserti]
MEKLRLSKAAAAELGAFRVGLRPGSIIYGDPANGLLRRQGRAQGSPGAVSGSITRMAARFDRAEPPFRRLRAQLRSFRPKQRVQGGQPSAEHRLQVLEGAAADLAGSAPLEEVLDRISARADDAVHAPGYLLAVQLPAGGRHVRVRGMGEVLAAALGDDGVSLDLDCS